MTTETSRTTPKKKPPVSAAAKRLMAEAEKPADPTAPTWEWAGETWTLANKPDVRAIAMAQRGDFARPLAMILGFDEATRLLYLETDEEFGSAEMWDLLNAWVEPETGATAGE